MPVDEDAVAFFVNAIVATVDFAQAAEWRDSRETQSLRDRLGAMIRPLPNPEQVRHGCNRRAFDFRSYALLLAATPEDPPALPVATLRWDFTCDPPLACIRVMLFYPDPDDPDTPFRTTGYRWELPSDLHSIHNYPHAQPIRSLHAREGGDPKCRTMSDRVPTFWLGIDQGRPDRLLANALISLYGADPGLLTLLQGIQGYRTALGPFAS
jgi:hypothetical protein